MRYLVLSVLLSLPFAACASNIKDTDLLTSNTLMLPPAKAKRSSSRTAIPQTTKP